MIRNLFNERGAFSADRYMAPSLYKSIFVDEILFEEALLEEGSYHQEVLDKGGIVTFSTDMNSTKMSKNKLVNWIKQKFNTVKNRITADSKINKVAADSDLAGWTVTKGLHGRYRDRNTGELFDENSISIELIGITNDVLLDFSEKLCKEFNQQSVLVKSYNSNDIWFVENPDGI